MIEKLCNNYLVRLKYSANHGNYDGNVVACVLSFVCQQNVIVKFKTGFQTDSEIEGKQ